MCEITEINIDYDRVIDKMKPVHGFNNCSRKTGYGELLPDFARLRPPVVRLHDTCGPYGGSHYVDVPNIFPDFNADPDNPESYDFTLTDCYIMPLAISGIKVMYRLGVTIEHEPKKYNIFAPENPEKWSDICEHIVRHYNDGWANGHHWNIEYWEIWNEPDGLNPQCEPFGCPNWIGTAEQYYELYSLTANRIKEKHPDVKVGGYSSCYILGKYIDGSWAPGDASFFTGFLEYISNKPTAAPLDFFTWHGYLGKQYLDKIGIEFNFVNDMLNKYGFLSAERIDAEWNINICDIDTSDRRTQYYINYRNEKGASHCAASMYEMQRCGIDMAMYYETQLWKEYGCLFEVPSLKPTKAWYAFEQFGELFRLGLYCFSTQKKNIYTCAAKGDRYAVGVSNISGYAQMVKLSVCGADYHKAEIYITDADRDNTMIYRSAELPECIEIPAYSFITVNLI